MLKRAGDKALPAAVGITVANEPIVRDALKRVREGKLSRTEFASLYSGPVNAGVTDAKAKHAPGHGFNSNLTAAKYLQSLTKF